MKDDVKACVDARVNFFAQYVEVSDALRPEVDDFIRRVTELGENAQDAAAFEAAFASGGLSDAFNGLIPRCTPKPYTMTQEDKARAKATAKEMLFSDKKGLAKDMASEALDTARVYGEQEMLSRRRKAMIESGTFRDYTVMTNRMEDAQIIAKGIKGFFQKRKEKKEAAKTEDNG